MAVTAPLTGSRTAPAPAPRFALPAARGRALAALGAGGALLIAIGVALTLTSDHATDPAAEALTGGLLMATWIGTGLFAWSRRPHNRIGPLMVATGYTAFLGALGGSSDPVVSALGAALTSAFLAPAVHMLLAFPSGRVETRAQRRLLAAAYAVLVPAPVVFVLFTRDLELAPGRPENGLLIADVPVLVRVVEAAAALAGIVVIVGVAVVLVRRWRAAAARERRALTPVLMTGLALIGLLAVLLAVQGRVEDRVADAVALGAVAALAAVPFAFLLGLVRSRSWRTGAVTELVEVLGEAPARGALRDALADALGDPSLELAFWLPDDRRYVDADGRDVRLPAGGDGRVATEVERDGRRVGALVHDPALCDEPELVRAVGAAAALALLNERLDAELRARVEELRRSRQRIVEAGMAERRRLERDLHDGAQQRLVALALQLGLAGAQLAPGPENDTARQLLGTARDEARAALEDLRELARGIHPAVLTDRGLGAAVEALADRSPVPVEVVSVPGERLPAVVEAAAYFVVAEALTNVAKYAGATHAEVRLAHEHGFALVEVRDDGAGGADPSAGSGLRGLADRLAALDGRLDIDSPPGRGTAVRARIPC